MTAHPARFWLGLLAAFVLALWLLRHILLPFVLGMAVGYLLDPLVRDRGRRPMRAKDKGTGRRKSRKISERSWKFRAAADEGNARTLIAVTTAQARVCYLRRARPASDATRIAPITCGLLTGLLRRVAAASQRRARRDSPAHGGTPAYPLNDLRSLPSPRGALPPR